MKFHERLELGSTIPFFYGWADPSFYPSILIMVLFQSFCLALASFSSQVVTHLLVGLLIIVIAYIATARFREEYRTAHYLTTLLVLLGLAAQASLALHQPWWSAPALALSLSFVQAMVTAILVLVRCLAEDINSGFVEQIRYIITTRKSTSPSS